MSTKPYFFPERQIIEYRTNSTDGGIIVPSSLENEDPRWLEVTIIQDVFGRDIQIVQVNETLKSTIQTLDSTKINSHKWDHMRLTRDNLLKESDYIMMPDYPLADKSAYETYRQALRDLPSTIVDIDNFSYPVKP